MKPFTLTGAQLATIHLLSYIPSAPSGIIRGTTHDFGDLVSRPALVWTKTKTHVDLILTPAPTWQHDKAATEAALSRMHQTFERRDPTRPIVRALNLRFDQPSRILSLHPDDNPAFEARRALTSDLLGDWFGPMPKAISLITPDASAAIQILRPLRMPKRYKTKQK